MKLTLKRNPSNSACTIGRLFVDGSLECVTLEDIVREHKIPGETAIPAGRYKVIINMSNRFKTLLPLLLEVPGFEGVRIHPGNEAKNTEGCILVGSAVSSDGKAILKSRIAFDALFAKMRAAVSRGEAITLEIA